MAKVTFKRLMRSQPNPEITMASPHEWYSAFKEEIWQIMRRNHALIKTDFATAREFEANLALTARKILIAEESNNDL